MFLDNFSERPHKASIFSKHFADYVYQKSQKCQDERKSKELAVLATFLFKNWTYFNAFDSSDYEMYTIETRVDDIKCTSNWLLSSVRNLTANARDSLEMNKNSLQALLKLLQEKGIERKLCLRGISTLTVENFFSLMRAMTTNPSIPEFQRNFDKSVNELDKELHANELGYNLKVTNTKKHHYAKSIINDSKETSKMPKIMRRPTGKRLGKGIQKQNKLADYEVKKKLRGIKNSMINSSMTLRDSYSKPKLETSGKISELV